MRIAKSWASNFTRSRAATGLQSSVSITPRLLYRGVVTGNGNYGIAGQQWVPPLRAAGLMPAASLFFEGSGVRRRRLASLRFASYVQTPSLARSRDPPASKTRSETNYRPVAFPRFRKLMTRAISTAVLPRIRQYHDVSLASAVVKSSTTTDFYVQTATTTGGEKATVKTQCLGLSCVSQEPATISSPSFILITS